VPLRELDGHSGAVHSLAISPDSRRLLSGGFDRTVQLWDLESGAELRTYAMRDGVEALDFSPDGRLFVSGGFDKTAQVWDLESGRENQLFVGHSDVVKSAIFSPDGASVITASADNTARLWSIDYRGTVQALCSRLRRDFTSEERAQFGIPAGAATCGGVVS
jgi:WD40 repeat protein